MPQSLVSVPLGFLSPLERSWFARKVFHTLSREEQRRLKHRVLKDFCETEPVMNELQKICFSGMTPLERPMCFPETKNILRQVLSKREFIFILRTASKKMQQNKNQLFNFIQNTRGADLLCRVMEVFDSVPFRLDVNAVHNKRTLLQHAVMKRRPDVVKYLLKRPDIDPNADDCTGHNGGQSFPLVRASGECLKLLLADPRTDVNKIIATKDLKATFSKLHVYFGNDGNIINLKYLLRHPSIDVNIRDSSGQSPLFAAAYGALFLPAEKHLEALDLFLEDERVMFSIRDNDGKTLIDAINSFGEHEFAPNRKAKVLKMIRKHEKVRLQFARDQISTLTHWMPAEKHIHEDVLNLHVLPYLADVISPLE
eukprot:gene219-946_t